MEEQLLQFCLEKGFLVDSEILSLFHEFGDVSLAQDLLERFMIYSNKHILTKNFLTNTLLLENIFTQLPENHKIFAEKLRVRLGLNIEISREVTPILYKQENDEPILSNSPVVLATCSQTNFNRKIFVNDFVRHYKNRFIEFQSLLRERKELDHLISINKLSSEKQQVSLISIVFDKRITKNKNILLRVEDLTGTTSLLISAAKTELYKKAEDIVLDSILGFRCSGTREMMFVNDIVFPEAGLPERKFSPEDVCAAFIGDLHVGTGKFLEKSFLRFIDYLNGKLPGTIPPNKIKYLFIVGDIVCGVGIYPGQEKELVIKDLEGQFQKTAELLSLIRKDIRIVICPGNHDGVRLLEPQPIFDEKYAWPLYNLENITLVTNPAMVNFGAIPSFSGFNLLFYHGYSYHYYADNVGHLRRAKATNSPEKIMAFLLKHRHLAPTHSSTLYFPLEKDQLFIRDVPDILFSGHTHKSAVSYFQNVLIISGSTWESKTEFQEKMGNEPDFCKVPVFNLKTRAINILDFE